MPSEVPALLSRAENPSTHCQSVEDAMHARKIEADVSQQPSAVGRSEVDPAARVRFQVDRSEVAVGPQAVSEDLAGERGSVVLVCV
jgi:hypothetical protein